MKILLFMGNGSVVNSAGGAEKVLCNMANEMVHRGHHVAVVCNDFASGVPFYPLHESVKFFNLDGSGHKKKYPQYLKIWRELTRPLRKRFSHPIFSNPVENAKIREMSCKFRSFIYDFAPDVVIPYFLDDLYTLTSLPLDDNIPVILMHHGNPQTAFLNESVSKLRLLQKCAVLQLLLPSYQSEVQAIFPNVRTAIIPNTVEQVTDADIANLGKKKSEFVIVNVARLSPEKQLHLLINAFSMVAYEFPNWKIHLYGKVYDQEYKDKLDSLITHKKLQNQVFFMGSTQEPMKVLQNCDLFAFPSKFEGFGIALAEAMSVGLPCVGLKTTTGVNELIVDGVNGFLSENNEEDYAKKLKMLMDDQELRVKMGKAGHEFVKQFAPEKIWDQWENLIQEVVQKHPDERLSLEGQTELSSSSKVA